MRDFNKWLSDLTKDLKEYGDEFTPEPAKITFEADDEPLWDLNLDGVDEDDGSTPPTPRGNHSHQLTSPAHSHSHVHQIMGEHPLEMAPQHDPQINHQIYVPLGTNLVSRLYPDVVGVDHLIYDEFTGVQDAPVKQNVHLASEVWRFLKSAKEPNIDKAIDRYRIALTDQYGWYMSEPVRPLNYADGRIDAARLKIFCDGPAAHLTIIDTEKGRGDGKGDYTVFRIPVAASRVPGHVELCRVFRGDELMIAIVTETFSLTAGHDVGIDDDVDDELPF